MKKTTLFMRFLSLAVFVSVVIVSPMYGGDPNNCVDVQGIAQIHLLDFGNPDWEGGRPGDAWVGPVQLALGPNKVLVGKVSEYDGEPDRRITPDKAATPALTISISKSKVHL